LQLLLYAMRRPMADVWSELRAKCPRTHASLTVSSAPGEVRLWTCNYRHPLSAPRAATIGPRDQPQGKGPRRLRSLWISHFKCPPRSETVKQSVTNISEPPPQAPGPHATPDPHPFETARSLRRASRLWRVPSSSQHPRLPRSRLPAQSLWIGGRLSWGCF
jgi:hypothetical protein